VSESEIDWGALSRIRTDENQWKKVVTYYYYSGKTRTVYWQDGKVCDVSRDGHPGERYCDVKTTLKTAWRIFWDGPDGKGRS